MKHALSSLLAVAALTAVASAQTTVSNLNQDPITYPNSTITNVRSWGSSTGALVGCGSNCSVSGSMSHTSYYTLSGDSLQLNINNPSGCDSQCYGDVDFSDKLYSNNSTASSANNFTLDVYVTTDSVGNAASQALEFTIEQDVPSTRTSGAYWDRYIYSWQCNYKGAVQTPYVSGAQGGVWNYWDGTARNGAGDWHQAVTTSGATVPCQPYTPGSFVHYYFHFTRNLSTHQIQFVDFTTVNAAGTSTYHQFNQTAGIQSPQANWSTGLFTAIQLDGDANQDQYSVWADNWTVAFQ
jgi:hypothetical protein